MQSKMRIITNAKDKAESSNHFFSKVGERLANDILLDKSVNVYHHIHQVTPTVEPLQLNDHKIKRVIDKRVKLGKGCDPDNMNARGLKLEGDDVIVGLSYVMGESLKTTKYPSQWKMSTVKGIPKKGNSSERGDLRPISLLSIPSKIYESIRGDYIDCHFVNKELSSDNQWGFKPNRSTELLMVHLTEVWRQQLGKNRIVGVLFIALKRYLIPFVLKQWLLNFKPVEFQEMSII